MLDAALYVCQCQRLSDIEFADTTHGVRPIMKTLLRPTRWQVMKNPLAVAHEAFSAHKVGYRLNASRDCCGNHAGI